MAKQNQISLWRERLKERIVDANSQWYFLRLGQPWIVRGFNDVEATSCCLRQLGMK